jgi:pimeloyl-ACP methyl ester carboxylesterase
MSSVRHQERPNHHVLPDGRVLAWTEHGDPSGQPVLGLHGTPTSSLTFATASPEAQRLGLRIVAPDRPGYGGSTPHAGATLSSIAGDVADLSSALALSQPIILGISGGGPAAVAVAARLGSAVAALGLLGPVGPVAASSLGSGQGPDIAWRYRLMFREAARWGPVTRFGLQTARLVFRSAPHPVAWLAAGAIGRDDRRVLRLPGIRPAQVRAVGHALAPGVAGIATDIALFSRPWDFDLADVTAPALVWLGAADRVVPRGPVERLVAALPNARLNMVPSAGHFWFLADWPAVLAPLAALARR